MKRMVQHTFQIEESKLTRLRALSDATGVPMSVYVREGLDRVLELAGKQMGTIAVLQELSRAKKEGTKSEA